MRRNYPRALVTSYWHLQFSKSALTKQKPHIKESNICSSVNCSSQESKVAVDTEVGLDRIKENGK